MPCTLTTSFLAETELEADVTIADVARGITTAGDAWKLDSLEVMPCGNLIDNEIHLTAQQHNLHLPFKTIDRLQLLGNLVTNNASTNDAMDHRLAQAEKGFWKNHKKLRRQGSSHSIKLEVWST